MIIMYGRRIAKKCNYGALSGGFWQGFRASKSSTLRPVGLAWWFPWNVFPRYGLDAWWMRASKVSAVRGLAAGPLGLQAHAHAR